MKTGGTVWVWDSSGSIVSGKFVGIDGNWCKVDTGDYIKFKKKCDVFISEDTALAWQFVKRVKRLLNKGIPIREVISTEDKKQYDLALELFPEELI